MNGHTNGSSTSTSGKMNGVSDHAIVDIIKKKRDGAVLERAEIAYFINGAVRKYITEAQIGAMLMAICLKGMSDEETQWFTEAMIESGKKLSYPKEWRGTIVGKHSTGGVGDKVSIILVPALAACGLRVPKIAGRGLGHTGGTLDKLEAIKGFRVSCTAEEIVDFVNQAGCCIVGQTSSLVPADKVLYAIRDTTGTTESVPLVSGSVMSKKAAECLDALSLEVTYGKAALVKTKEDGIRLAKAMTETGKRLGIRTTAILTKMYNPLGRTIGNSVEVVEAIECLNGKGPNDLMEVVTTLGSYLLVHTGRADDFEQGQAVIRRVLEDGSAACHFQRMMIAQGVDADLAERLMTVADPASLMTPASHHTDITANSSGYIHGIDAYICGCITRNLGAGRQVPEDSVDHSVGMKISKDIGEYIETGEIWATIHHNTTLCKEDIQQLESALQVKAVKVSPEQLKTVAGILE